MKHSDPRDLRADNSFARAPYNFVSLPHRMVAANEIPDGESYHPGTSSGWLECTLETRSPLYIRGMLTQQQFELFGESKADKLTPEQKAELASFFSTSAERVEGRPAPVIPGSSLRGMLRSLVEIIGYGRMRWVAAKPTFTFRAVAAKNDDPLREPYRQVIGQLAANVRAGYLEKAGDDWRIHPAKRPSEAGLRGNEAFLKVPEERIPAGEIPALLRFAKPDYQPGYAEVSFQAESRRSQRGEYSDVTQIGRRERGLRHKGCLVWSGSMLESESDEARRARKLRRRKHTLILERKEGILPLKIDPQAVKDYEAGLSPFQETELKMWTDGRGCLKDKAPVFYVEPRPGEPVRFFGHSPNFRIPARLANASRAATPLDFVPENLRSAPRPDLADAIFGWVEETGSGPAGQRAGRVTFSDAHYTSSASGVWLKDQPIALHVLSGPKATTFQHYLVQNSEQGHSPDEKLNLAHYGTPPGETELRGHKLYWIKGQDPDIEATLTEKKHESQLARVIPLKSGVSFSFKIHFENLRDEELGLLLWALELPGQEGVEHCHRLGMGKPLGMGVVSLSASLHLIDRKARYTSLFDGQAWQSGGVLASPDAYLQKFEAFLWNQLAPEDQVRRAGAQPGSKRLADLARIEALLTMLEWREGDAAWQDLTRYMEIERAVPGSNSTVNEYKERPVLPSPQGVIDLAKGQTRLRPAGSSRSSGANPSRYNTASQGRYNDRRSQPNRPSHEPRRDEGMMHGEVQRYGMDGKPYGFIKPDGGGKDVFVHASQLRDGLRSLQPGQRVVYRPITGTNGGPAAADVRLEQPGERK